MKGLIDFNAPWIPSLADEMLLMAALAPAGKAHDAGLAWLTNANLAAQTEATCQLLPLVHERLVRDGIEHPTMAILKGVKRKVWSRNHLLFRHASPAIQALRQAGIDVMLLKGAAVTLSYYQNYGLRPMGDFDLMVRFKDVSAAIEILTENGWKSEFPMHGKLGQNILTYTHAMHFKDNSGLDLDFHWHLSPLCVDSAADSSFWSDSITAKFDSVDARLLNPADQLLHICVHGLTCSRIPSIHWIPDSMEIIRKDNEFDWNRLLLQAQERRLTLYVRSALNYLVDKFEVAVPRDVLKEMNARPVTSDETREYILFTKQRFVNPLALQKHNSIPVMLQVLFYTYRRIAAGAKLCVYNVTVMEYLYAYYRKENVWRLFCYILDRIGRRALRSIRRLALPLRFRIL